MHRAIVVTVGVLVVFAMVVVVTLMVRKKQSNNNINPYDTEFKEYQEDMMNNGYDIYYDSEPTNLQKEEDLIYQLRAKMSDVNFELDSPETKPEPTTLWVTNKRLIVERRGKAKKSYSFNFDEIQGFEFELEKNKYVFLFEYKEQIYKYETRDIYAVALIELKTRIKRK